MAPTIRHREAIDFSAFFRERKCAMPDIGLLQPADPILNAAGEDIRRRIFMTADQRGNPLCLRPEFTIPVCLHHVAGGKPKQRYGYVGKVFRQRREEADEFFQAGIEDIGSKNSIAADARSLSEAVALLRALGARKLSVSVGDQAIFDAVLTSLGLPEAWRQRLGRSFGDGDRLAADLERLSGSNGNGLSRLAPALREKLLAGDEAAVRQTVEAEMAAGGLSAQGGRSAGEIAARLLQKAELIAVDLPEEKRRVLEAFLSLDLALHKSNQRLWAFARRYGIELGAALERFHKRCVAIEKLALSDTTIRYRAGFGRRLDYYTGFVFEIRAAGHKAAPEKPLAGGGRYDGLLDLLGAEAEMPAIGFAVYVDRVRGGKDKRKGSVKLKKRKSRAPATAPAPGRSPV